MSGSLMGAVVEKGKNDSRETSMPTSLKPHRFNFFEDLPADAWRDECPALSVVEFDDKKTVYLQGEAYNSFFLIVNGHVKLSRVNRQGGEFMLALMAKGELFGPASYHQMRLKRPRPPRDPRGSTASGRAILRRFSPAALLWPGA